MNVYHGSYTAIDYVDLEKNAFLHFHLNVLRFAGYTEEWLDFVANRISKPDFLNELKFSRETHQICFCTTRSLQMLDNTVNSADVYHGIFKIGEHTIERLMLDNHIDEIQAANLFYKSKTFALLADEGTKLYQKPWHEIYAMLKLEIETRPASP